MVWRQKRPPSLSRTIFATVIAFAVAAVAITAIALTSISYDAEERRSEEQLVSQARLCAQMLDAIPASEREQLLMMQVPGAVRFTLIEADGAVAFDSGAPAAQSADHSGRPEVIEAKEDGEGVLVRRSSTLQQDTLYVAERLQDGSLVRLSEERMSLMAFLGSMWFPVALALGSAVVLVVLLSRLLTARIMRPLDRLDLAQPSDGEAYEEMRPLLTRVRDQQRQLREQNEELKRSEGIRREFSSNVSHEMKTPLQVIAGYAEMIASGMAASEDVQGFAMKIYGESQRLRALINDVLTLSHLDDPSLADEPIAPVDLLVLAERACERVRPLADEAGIAVDLSGASVMVEGSEALLGHAVSNLVENAVRYNEPGGKVRVEVRADADGWACVAVADTGIGIPPEDQPKVFERFYRADKSRSKETGGTGLGLAIVKHAARYHGGDVQLQSTMGQGSSFTLRIPCRAPKKQGRADAHPVQGG